jgi:hypothetical protein
MGILFERVLVITQTMPTSTSGQPGQSLSLENIRKSALLCTLGKIPEKARFEGR